MDTKILEEIGLTKTEIKIYLALLKLGQTTTTQIIKDSQINPSKVYGFLDKLIQKGLVAYVIKSNKKYFSATDPSNLNNLLKEKQIKIEEQKIQVDQLVLSLKSLQKHETKIQSEIYEGVRGAKSVYELILSTLNKGETQYIIGAPKIGNELMEGYLLDWHKRRIKKGIKCEYIYDADVKDYGKIREQMPLTKVKYLPKQITSPVWIEVFKDYVAIGHIKGNLISLFLIRDKEIAKGYLDYFNLLWKQASK